MVSSYIIFSMAGTHKDLSSGRHFRPGTQALLEKERENFFLLEIVKI
jgi:hypothetical protein